MFKYSDWKEHLFYLLNIMFYGIGFCIIIGTAFSVYVSVKQGEVKVIYATLLCFFMALAFRMIHTLGLLTSKLFVFFASLLHLAAAIFYGYILVNVALVGEYIIVFGVFCPLIFHFLLAYLMICYFYEYTPEHTRKPAAEVMQIDTDVQLHYFPEEASAASVVKEAYQHSLPILNKTWSMDRIKKCHIFIESNYFHVFFRLWSWHHYIFAAIFNNFQVVKHMKALRYTGGITVSRIKKSQIVINTWNALQRAHEKLPEKSYIKIFVPEFGVMGKYTELVVCHEMTHVVTSHLALPFWLNEGIAMLMTDEYFGKQTVRNDTLLKLDHHKRRISPVNYYRLGELKLRDIRFYYIRAYWMTRYLKETHPDLFDDFMQKKQANKLIQKKVAAALGIKPRSLWAKIDRIVYDYFKDRVDVESPSQAAENGDEKLCRK